MKPLNINANGAINFHDAERDVMHSTAGGSAESSSIPAKATQAVLRANDDFWFNTQATAAIPSADVTDGSGSTPIWAGETLIIAVPPGGTLSGICANTGSLLSISYFGQ